MAVPDLKGFAFNEQADPNAQKGLAGILDPHAWSDSVCQAQGASAEAIDIIVKNMVCLPSHLINAVDVHRVERMFLINRQVLGLAVNLSSARKDDLDLWIVLAAGFQDRNLRAAVDVQVGVRVLHRIRMTRLPRQIEEEVLSLDQIAHAVLIAHIGDVDLHPAVNIGDVAQIAPIFWN